jgi:glycosyltransferase involved in cell wall biosynthesis
MEIIAKKMFMNQKKKAISILQVIYSGSPSQYALGPAQTADAIAQALAKNVPVIMASVGYDRLLKRPIGEEGLKTTNVAGLQRIYVRRDWFMLFRLLRIIKMHDGPCIIHCAFDYRFALPALLFRLAKVKSQSYHVPHGMLLDIVFERHYRAKQLFCLLWRVLVPKGRVIHIVSSEYERQSVIRHLGRTQNIKIIRQITTLEAQYRPTQFEGRQENTKLKLCFVGRVTVQKNLLFVLSILQKIKFDVILDVYGSTENCSYFDACCAAIKELPNSIRVKFFGAVKREELLVKLKNYDLMFSPTLGENHGHNIMEALGTGLPVLISDRCPWTDINEFGGGWSLSLSAQSSYVKVLTEAYSSGSEWANVRRAASAYFDKNNVPKEAIRQYQELIIGA